MISIVPNNIVKDINLNNVNKAYFSMAKQLKINKNIEQKIKIENENKINFKLSKIEDSNSNLNNNKTKNISNSSLNKKNSLQIFNLNEENKIAGPEEMHFFNLNLAKYNKSLAFKFENIEEDLNFFWNMFFYL